MNENIEEAIKNRSTKLADSMNRISEALDVSDDLLVLSDDVESVVRDTIDFHEVSDANIVDLNILKDSLLSLTIMSEDFTYVRDTLKEITNNARKVQSAITLQLLSPMDEEGDTSALIVSFAELSKAITDAQKLYITSYKDMSITMLNLDKIKKAEIATETTNDNIEGQRIISTSDLIAEMKQQETEKEI